ncbi:hypothetical protein [Paenibacillus daejeonensis]|uniref:hypothetical protein n=1 Tax=Paenibacillus daejeonensis TaxID=135193 RepID=UPI0003603D4E|nr:hypothetical protein [Paenibacillus daejeonensis]
MADIKRKLLVKQVIGRLLLDTAEREQPFALEEQDGGWRIVIERVDPEKAEEIGRLSQDLNLFYFEEGPQGISKWWLYGKDEPLGLAYDGHEQVLTLNVDSRVAYSNEQV